MLKAYLKPLDGPYIKYIGSMTAKTVIAALIMTNSSLAQESCQSLFLSHYTETVHVDMQGSPSPRIHRLNLEEHLRKINIEELQVELPIKYLKNGETFWFESMNSYLRVKSILPRNQAIFQSYKGSEFQFSFRAQVNGILLQGQRAWIADPNVTPNLDAEASLKVTDGFHASISSIPKRIRSQIDGSRSFKDPLNQNLIHKKVKSIYERVFDKIKKNEPLSVEEIQDFNRKISRISLDTDHAIFAGVIRGSIHEEVQGSTLIRVDLTSWQMDEGGMFYLSAREVPKQLELLVEKINGINRNSQLNEILQLYELFIKIHPFVDGNGRTGRVLLDFMLIKAGFRAMNYREITMDEIFKTNQQMYNEAIEALILTSLYNENIPQP